MVKMKPAPSRHRLMELFNYDPDTGEFMRLKSTNSTTYIGEVLKGPKDRYLRIMIDNIRYKAHRLAWLYVYGEWPEDFIDHKNGLKGDNRIANLRLATFQQNIFNRNVPRNNTTGAKGVIIERRRDQIRFVAQIRKDKKRVCLGRFKTVEEARDAYDKAAIDLFGEYAPRSALRAAVAVAYPRRSA